MVSETAQFVTLLVVSLMVWASVMAAFFSLSCRLDKLNERVGKLVDRVSQLEEILMARRRDSQKEEEVSISPFDEILREVERVLRKRGYMNPPK